jgi:hypothetical protein
LQELARNLTGAILSHDIDGRIDLVALSLFCDMREHAFDEAYMEVSDRNRCSTIKAIKLPRLQSCSPPVLDVRLTSTSPKVHSGNCYLNGIEITITKLEMSLHSIRMQSRILLHHMLQLRLM